MPPAGTAELLEIAGAGFYRSNLALFRALKKYSHGYAGWTGSIPKT
jgi:hypothetical protein